MDDRTRSLLADMLAYARDARSFMPEEAAGLHADKMRQYAVIRAIEVVGEAAAKISSEERAALPELPWRSLIGMRNVLIHGYAALRLDLIIEAVQRDIPQLIAALETRLGESS